MGGACSTNGREVRYPEGKGKLGRPSHRWVDNIEMDLREIGWSDMDWIGLAQVRYKWRAFVNMVTVSIKCWQVRESFHNSWPLEKCSAP
jgi:hypothetical protein